MRGGDSQIRVSAFSLRAQSTAHDGVVTLGARHMSCFYRRSALYSAFFTPSLEMRDSIDRVLRSFLKRRPTRVIDPACGPGLWLAHFAAHGAEVAGCDLEEAAILGAAARLPARGARVLVGDMRRPPDELGTNFDCAINLDNSIGHLASYEDVVVHFASMRSRLSRNGVYVVGLALREARDSIVPGVVYERGPVDVEGGGFAALRTETLGLQPETRCERIRQVTITANIPETPTVIAEQYDLMTFTFAMLRDVLAASGGFDVLACLDATDEALPAKAFRKSAGDVVLVLRATKPTTKATTKAKPKEKPRTGKKPTTTRKKARPRTSGKA